MRAWVLMITLLALLTTLPVAVTTLMAQDGEAEVGAMEVVAEAADDDAAEAAEAEPWPDAPFKTMTEKVSYVLGVNIGRSMKRDYVDIDPELLARGLKDALYGDDDAVIVSDEDMQAVMEMWQETQMQRIQQKMAEQAAQNKADAAEFLAENAKRDEVTVTESGLQYEVLRPAEGPKPGPEDTVSVHYRGTLLDGKQFDSSYDRGQPATFPVGGVIPGWVEGLQLMSVGSKYKLYIPPELAYGERGNRGIEPNSALIFEVELLEIEKAEQPEQELELQDLGQ